MLPLRFLRDIFTLYRRLAAATLDRELVGSCTARTNTHYRDRSMDTDFVKAALVSMDHDFSCVCSECRDLVLSFPLDRVSIDSKIIALLMSAILRRQVTETSIDLFDLQNEFEISKNMSDVDFICHLSKHPLSPIHPTDLII